jgi:hypothetical protein
MMHTVQVHPPLPCTGVSSIATAATGETFARLDLSLCGGGARPGRGGHEGLFATGDAR